MTANEKTRLLRREKKVHKSELCEACGFSLEEYDAFEDGTTNFQEYQLRIIAKYLRVPIEYLLGDKDYLVLIEKRNYRRKLALAIPYFILTIAIVVTNLVFSIIRNLSLIDIILVNGIILITSLIVFPLLLYCILKDEFTLIRKMYKLYNNNFRACKNALFEIMFFMLTSSIICTALFTLNYFSIIPSRFSSYFNLAIIILYLFLFFFSYIHINRKYINRFKKGLV